MEAIVYYWYVLIVTDNQRMVAIVTATGFKYDLTVREGSRKQEANETDAWLLF